MIYTSIPKRKPKKPNAQQRQLAADWTALMKKYEPKKPVAKQSSNWEYKLSTPPGRTTSHDIPSKDTGGIATAKQSMQYTGTKMIGIGTLHKSNAVPVFCDDEAKEMARMRRG